MDALEGLFAEDVVFSNSDGGKDAPIRRPLKSREHPGQTDSRVPRDHPSLRRQRTYWGGGAARPDSSWRWQERRTSADNLRAKPDRGNGLNASVSRWHSLLVKWIMGCVWAARKCGCCKLLKFKKRETGIEPATSSLGAPGSKPACCRGWKSPTGKENSESILASSLAVDIARCRLKRRQRYRWAWTIELRKDDLSGCRLSPSWGRQNKRPR